MILMLDNIIYIELCNSLPAALGSLFLRYTLLSWIGIIPFFSCLSLEKLPRFSISFEFVFFQNPARGGVIGSICIKSEQVLREKPHNWWHNWIYVMQIEISSPQVQISPLMTPGTAWISTFPISLAQVRLQGTEIWSKCVILGFISRDLGNCSLIISTLSCPHVRSVVNINYLGIGRLNLEGICIPTSFPGWV